MTLLTKEQYRNEMAVWLEQPSLRQSNALFTVNIVFKQPEKHQVHLTPDDWLSLYRKSFMWKLNRQFTRKQDAHYAKSLGAHYERETKSMYHAVDNRSPHHVHDLVAFPIGLESKIWDVANKSLTSRFETDLYTSTAIYDCVMVPLKPGTAHTWIKYISKGNEGSGF